MTDELRTQLSRLDPMPPDVATEPVTTQSSRHRMERVMSSIVQQPIAVVGFLTAGGYFEREPSPIVAAPVEFSLGENDSMAMCLAFDVEILRPMEVAFEGSSNGFRTSKEWLQLVHLTCLTSAPPKRASSYRYFVSHWGQVMITARTSTT